jgi:hypothetical protein
MNTRGIFFACILNVEERADGWYFSTHKTDWVGPYPTFAALTEQIGNYIEATLFEAYRNNYNEAPR